jgi:hypothetical protein
MGTTSMSAEIFSRSNRGLRWAKLLPIVKSKDTRPSLCVVDTNALAKDLAGSQSVSVLSVHDLFA